MICLIVLFVFLLVALLVSYRVFRNLLSPSVVVSGIFLVGTIFAIIGNFKWKADFSLWALYLVIFSCVALFLGELVGTRMRVDSIGHSQISHRGSAETKIDYFLVIILSVFCFFCTILYIREQISLAYQFGYKGVLFFKYLRSGLYSGAIEQSTVSNISSMFVEVTGYFLAFIFIYRKVYFKNKRLKKDVLLLIPIVLYAVMQVFSAARAGFIAIIVFFIVCLYLTISRKRAIKLGRLIIGLLFAFLLFIIAFSLLGVLTAKTNEANAFDKICLYAGSSLPALSDYLDRYISGYRSGSVETFTGFANLLVKLGGGSTSVTSFSLEYVYFADESRTNIYTAIRSYLNDYGFFGVVFIQAAVGMIFGYWSVFLKKSKKVSPLSVVMFSYYLYRLVCTLFTPGLTSTFLTIGGISRLVFAIAFYILFIRSGLLFKGNKGDGYERYYFSGRIRN